MDLDLRLIYPYGLFKGHQEASAHFLKHWRSDNGLSYEQLVKSALWPPTLLQPNAAVFDGDVWLLSICLQERLSANEIFEKTRMKEQQEFGKRIGRVFGGQTLSKNRDSRDQKPSERDGNLNDG